MRVLFLTHFFPPEIGPPQTRILETARDLQQMGHAVAVLTTFPNYPSGEIPAGYRGRVLMREEMEGIPVVRSWLYAAPNRGFLRRSLSHLSFALSALPAATRLPWRPDVIVVDMHPLFLCVTAAILGRWWGVPYVLNAGDLIPEQAVAYGVMRNPIAIRVTRALASFALNHAAQVVPFTRGIEAALRERGIPPERLHLIYYGADVELFQEPIPEGETIPGLESIAPDAFVVMYAGTHGLPHALDTVLDTAELLADEPDVHLLLVGDGGEKPRLVAKARERGLANITFLDPVPRRLLPALYRRADACLVTLRRSDWLRDFALSSKVFDVMAAGRPAIVAAEGETADVVEHACAGLCVPPEDPAALAEAIRALRARPALARQLGENGQRYVAAHVSRQRQSRAFETVLRQAVEAAPEPHAGRAAPSGWARADAGRLTEPLERTEPSAGVSRRVH
ncbi:glycosyltransferase family 4 protein [Sphaerobacter thermophilus]|uniref:glycosyltransferase family 4 protein n=1 Tax=Sphaerobacter thermophilus TaxID=2057 RepID=UPI0039C0B0EB